MKMEGMSETVNLFDCFVRANHCCPEKFYHKVGCSTEPASGTLTGVVG